MTTSLHRTIEDYFTDTGGEIPFDVWMGIDPSELVAESVNNLAHDND